MLGKSPVTEDVGRRQKPSLRAEAHATTPMPALFAALDMEAGEPPIRRCSRILKPDSLEHMKLALIAAIPFLATLVLEGSDRPGVSNQRKINVVAIGSDGRPVTDLRESDFQIYEDGKPEKISFFRFTGEAPRRATVILIDLLSDRTLSDAVIGAQVAATLEKVKSSEDIYLYFLTPAGVLYPIRALPEPGSEATSAPAPWTKAIDEAVRKFALVKPLDNHDLQIRFDSTFASLQALDYQMQLFAGRKTLVWVSHGLPLRGPSMTRTFLNFSDPVRRLAEHLERDQIAVYPVRQSLAGDDAVGTESSQTLDLFASITGRRMYQTDAAGDAIQRAWVDSLGNYQVMYETTSLNADGRQHKVEAICGRKDVRLLTEREFYGFELPAQSEIEGRAVENAAQSPIDAGEIGSSLRIGGRVWWRFLRRCP
jgi:VWFA-related protein